MQRQQTGAYKFEWGDLANLVNEAALTAARIGRSVITMIDFENAKDKVMVFAKICGRSFILNGRLNRKNRFVSSW